MPVLYVSFAAVLVLALVHVFVPSMRFLDGTPRSVWLSIAGGVSVAYVFVHLLPELAAGQEKVERSVSGAGGMVEHHIYLIALLGLAVFYGVERMAKASHQRERAERGEDQKSTAVFWIHLASFGVYNVLIGYLLLHLEKPGVRPLLLFTLAMALHFTVTDHGLHEEYRKTYRDVGRWVLLAAVAGGWALGWATELSELWIAILVAFLAGGVILNVMKEELPSERQSRFWAFAVGATAYTALLLAL